MSRSRVAAVLLILAGSLAVLPSTAGAATGPIHSWNFDEPSGIAIDSAGGLNGAPSSGATRVVRGAGRAVSLAGNTNGRVTIAASALQFGTSDFTIAFLARKNNNNTIRDLLGNRTVTSGGNFVGFRSTGSNMVFEVDDLPGANYGAAQMATGFDTNWHRVVATRQGTNLRLYFDGRLVGTGTTAGVTNLTSSTPFIIGSGTGAPHPAISVDDVTIWNRALAAREIESHLWLADNNTFDAIGAQDGVVTGTVTYGTGAGGTGQAFVFNGTGGRVNLGTLAGNFGNSDGHISFDIKTTQTADSAILSKRPNCTGAGWWDLRMNAAGRIGAEFHNGSAYAVVMASTSVNDGQWHRVLASRMGAQISISVDGGPQVTASLPVGPLTNTGPTLAGWSPCVGLDSTQAPISSLDNIRITTELQDFWAPTISGSRNPAPNAAGWNRTAVTVSFACSDNHSGVATCTAPTSVTAPGTTNVSGTATDHYGNQASTSTQVNIDMVPPQISSSFVNPQIRNGWHSTSPVVAWTCNDAISGIATCPSNTTISGEGTALSASGQATDVAGNTATATVTNVRVDKTAPVTTVTVPSGYVPGPVNLTINASDNLSGVESVHYRVDGGPEQTGTTVPVSGDGAHTVTTWAKDVAGNVGTENHVTVYLDSTAPSISHVIDPAPNAALWNNTNTQVIFSCSDATSGVASCTPPTDITIEGAGQNVNGTAIDNAGNMASDVATVNLDRTNPIVTAHRAPAANAAGWHNAPVTVSFSCQDALSGVASCAADEVISSEGHAFWTSGDGADAAGNTASALADGINIDLGDPTITGEVLETPNANGWHNTPVTVRWTCSDALSGIAVCPADVVLSGNGTDLSVMGVAIDVAGNTASATVTGIDIDRIAPTISGAPTTAPNAAGWHDDDITVAWTCDDDLSGVDSCNTDTLITGEGDALSVSGDASDNAGNLASAGAGPFRIDRTAPLTVADAPGGYHRASSLTVNLSASDNLSGVASTTYTLDGTPGTGNQVDVSGDGTHTLTFRSTDVAGNVEDERTVQVLLDGAAPAIVHTVSPVPNAAGWNRNNTTVSFSCSDATSGIVFCSGPSTITANAANQQVTGTARDDAGNESTRVVTVHLDKVQPTNSASRSPLANAAGWNNSPVAVSFTCNDALSGIASCTGLQVVNTETSGTNVTGTAVDVAGNTRNATASNIRIDLTPPTITGEILESPNAEGWFSGPVTVRWTCSDARSGVAVCPADTLVSGEGASQTASGVAIDVAGNSNTGSVVGINIDLSAPEISGAASVAPNGAGWYRDDVTIEWTCSDAVSGVASCPADSTIGGEGANLSAQAVAYDVAGHQATGNVTGVQIDRTPPTTTADAPGSWVRGTVTVNLVATDNLSGVDLTTYELDDVAGTGNSVQVSGNGEHTLRFRSVDAAGNLENDQIVQILIDDEAPTITHSIAPVPNAAGWNRTNPTVSFTCSDAKAGVAFCSGPTTLTSNGANQQVVGTARDLVGNEATDTATVHLDKTQPTNTATRTPAANAAGWNNSPVTVGFTCTDALSGVAVCPDAVVVSAETAGTSVTRQAVDVAGNTRNRTVNGIRVDLTDPTITGEILETPTAEGWFNGPVTVRWTCSDALSGVASCPADTVVSGEGEGQSVAGLTTDVAGNTGSAVVSGINIDLTMPAISGAPTTSPNASGWYRDDVTVAWTCSDALSGVRACPADSVVTGEGAALSASGTATDRASNDGSATVGGLQLDRTAPVTTADAPAGYRTETVTVTLTAIDNLSGIARTDWTLDGVDGTGPTVEISGDGTHTLTFRSTDVADNVEDLRTVEVLIDGTAPTIVHEIDPVPNAAGWNRVDTTVTFTCGDATSGVAECTDPTEFTTDGAAQTVVGRAVDVAGNESLDPVSVNLDKTAPVIVGSRVPAANSFGWANEDVTVSFACTDATSGVASCSEPTTFTEETDGSSVTGDAADTAENTASDTVSGIKIDTTLPTISGETLQTPNEDGWFDGPVTVRWTCDDALSGVAVCPADVTLTADGANQEVQGTVYDRAGNWVVGTVSGINIDQLRPVLTAVRSVEPNQYGWNNTDVVVTWTCTDARPVVLSEATYTFTAEGLAQSRTATCTDIAGNSISDTQIVNIDKTAPLTTIDQHLGGDLRGTATDDASGVDGTTVTWTILGSFSQQAVCQAGCGTVLARWRISPPQPRPNVYRVTARSIDRAGNIGPSSPQSTITAL